MMKPNINTKGRLFRGLGGLVLLAGSILAWDHAWWAGGVLALAASFLFLEACRGWCALRACGIKTKW